MRWKTMFARARVTAIRRAMIARTKTGGHERVLIALFILTPSLRFNRPFLADRTRFGARWRRERKTDWRWDSGERIG